MLGQAMVAEFTRWGDEVKPAGHSDLDITDLKAVKDALAALRPDLVVNCAAYTNVDRAESEPQLAMAVNALGPRNLALACSETGTALLHISTDYVFDGQKPGPYTIWDAPAPLNAYGASKLWGENYVRSLMTRYYVIRTSWLFGPGGKNFVTTMLELAGRGLPLRVVNDQHGCPTYTADLARACADLVRTGAFGIYHITNQEPTTWYRFAAEIFRNACLDVDLKPIPTKDFPRPAARPANSVLDPYPLKETLGYLLPPWQDALARYLPSVLNR
jgi:dTDP-4-dehydrorhamnose reductase